MSPVGVPRGTRHQTLYTVGRTLARRLGQVPAVPALRAAAGAATGRLRFRSSAQGTTNPIVVAPLVRVQRRGSLLPESSPHVHRAHPRLARGLEPLVAVLVHHTTRRGHTEPAGRLEEEIRSRLPLADIPAWKSRICSSDTVPASKSPPNSSRNWRSRSPRETPTRARCQELGSTAPTASRDSVQARRCRGMVSARVPSQSKMSA